MRPDRVITEADLDKVWGNANFGSTDRMAIVRESLLKRACGYHDGHTITCICQELGLITKSLQLTSLGRYNLYWMVEAALRLRYDIGKPEPS